MKKTTLVVMVAMLFNLLVAPIFAAPVVKQPEIEARVKPILEVDGLLFKDLNENGQLDPYEDWRLDIDDRITDLYSQMTVEERTRLLFHVCTCGDPRGIDFSDSRYLWEEDCPFDVPEPSDEAADSRPGGPGMFGNGSYSMWYYINVYGVTHYLDNSNGTPQDQIKYHNAIQEIGEGTRLGIPITLSSDRQFNAWGGMIDTPQAAFGVAGDLEIATQLWESYSKQTRAVGYHILLHPYGMELGSWNGEDPAYLGLMSKAEVEAIQVEGGAYACAKHFIARGGDSSFQDARSVAQTVDNWIYPWEETLKANPKWVMTNGYGTGLSNSVHVDYDVETMDYLRKTLGFDGVVLSDWGAQGDNFAKGITPDGIDMAELTVAERYALTINLGLDQIGNPGVTFETGGRDVSLNAVVEAVELGLISEERLEEACRRILRTKFELGLFENPYSSVEAALALSASEEYIQEQWEIVDNESLARARNPEEVELERMLMAKGAVLLKNDDNLLPLAEGTKVYIGSTASASNLAAYKRYLAQHGTVVEEIAEADVVVADFTSFSDAAELIVDDAADYGKKLVIVTNNLKPNTWAMEQGDAVLYLSFSRPADHGEGVAGFITTTEPDVYAELLFGVREPEGRMVKEITRSTTMAASEWKDLAGDMGATDRVRLMLLAEMKTNPTHSVPNNWGDPLLTSKYGMRYGGQGDFVFDTLVRPTVLTEMEVESMFGKQIRTVVAEAPAEAGVVYPVHFLLWNNGDDDVITVQAVSGDKVLDETLMAINGGSWRVVEFGLLFDEPGTYDVTIGTLATTIVVE